MVPCFEHPGRADAVLSALQGLGWPTVAPDVWGRGPLERVHDREYLDFLEHAHAAWAEVYPGEDALPYAIRTTPGGVVPTGLYGRLGHFALDTVTPITAGTWAAASAAVDVAMSAMQHVVDHRTTAFALTRPPGHHACAGRYGGYCYLNQAAAAAQGLVEAGCGRVAVLDVDVHHGNGTQQIFYERADVLFVSVHADPREVYPYFWGHPEERGAGPGEGFNVNLVVPASADGSAYGPALQQALARVAAHGAEALVVSLGLDAYVGDPLADLRLTGADYRELGARLAELDLPTLLVLEGGYDVGALGDNVVAVLRGVTG